MTKYTKKDLKKYLDMPHRIDIKKSESGGFFVSIPDLPGCYSQGETIEETYNMILDAKTAWIESALEDGEAIPEPSDEKKYSGRILLRIPPVLHSELSQKATLQGVSLNHYLTYLLATEKEKQPIKIEPHFHKTTRVDKINVHMASPTEKETYEDVPRKRISVDG